MLQLDNQNQYATITAHLKCAPLLLQLDNQNQYATITKTELEKGLNVAT